jgi:very-short-patch-repair endonuclease
VRQLASPDRTSGFGVTLRKLANHKPSRSPLLLAQRAAHMRVAPTPSEAALWAALRTCCGVAFRRQVPLVERFIADFFAPCVQLVIEVDGGCHARRSTADARRDIALRRAGYRTLRVTAERCHYRSRRCA